MEHAIADPEATEHPEPEGLARYEKFFGGDERKREMFAGNLALVAEVRSRMFDGKDKDNPAGFARLAEVLLKAAEQRARILGIDLKRTTTGERLETANQIADFAATAKEKIASALSRLQRDDAEEYEKARERLQETEKTD